MWAHFDALLATNAFFRIDHSDIAVFGADMARVKFAGLYAGCIRTLPAHMYRYVLRILVKDCPVHLNPGQGKADLAVMDEGTCRHAAVAAGAMF